MSDEPTEEWVYRVRADWTGPDGILTVSDYHAKVAEESDDVEVTIIYGW